MNPRNTEELNTEYRNYSIEAFDRAYEVMLEDEVDLAGVVKAFRESADVVTKNIPQDQWTAEDYARLMKISNAIIVNIMHHPVQNEISAKAETEHAMRLYHLADHTKVGLDFYLAAYEASVHYAGLCADVMTQEDEKAISFTEYAAYAAQAEEIAQKVWDNMADAPVDADTRRLVFGDTKLTYIYLVSGQYGNALRSASSAIGSLAFAGDLSVFDLYAVSDIYRNLAASFSFDPAYSQLFQFAADLFHGNPEANFRKLEEVSFALSHHQSEMDYQRNSMLLQIMRLWNAKHDFLPDDSVMNQEMRHEHCANRFEALLLQHEERESKYLQEIFTRIPLDDVCENTDDLLQRADNALKVKFPSLDELALPSPGLLSKQSIFKVEDELPEAPKQGREIKIRFGSSND